MMSPGREKWTAAGQIALLAFLSFLSHSGNIYSYFNYDDIPLIVENPYLRTWGGVWGLLKTGRPMRGLSFWLDYRIWGLSARGFHFTNLMLGIACVLAAYYLLQLIFHNRRLAFVSALIYAVHPVNSEAIIGIAHRKELLCFLFMVLSFIAFKKSGMAWRWLLASFIFYLPALLSKQVALVLPFLFALEALAVSRPEKMKRVWIISALFLAVPALGFVFSLSDFKFFGRFQPAEFFQHNYIQIISTQFKYYPKYLELAFFPDHLNIDHYVQYADSLLNPGALLGLLAFLASIIILVKLALARQPWALAWGWLVINLLPVMNFVPSNQIISERYLYIPCFGAAMVIALGFEKMGLAVKPYLGSRAFRIALFSAFNFLFLLIFFSGYLQGYQKLLWRRLPDLNLGSGSVFIIGTIPAAILLSIAIIFWNRRQEQKRPGIWKEYLFFLLVIITGYCLSAFIVSSLAYHKPVFPIPEAAVNYQRYEAALLLQMKHDSIHFTRTYPHGTNLIELINIIGYVVLVFSGVLMALNRIGRRLAAARSELLAAVLFAPILVGVLFGQSGVRSRDWGSEVSLWKSTVRENPQSFTGWNNLGRAYVDRKKFDEAIDCFIMAHSVEPYSLEPILNLGNVMVMFNRIDDAAHYYQWALLINPYSFLARLNLGNCFASQDDYNQAIEQYAVALQIKPDAFEADYGLAYAFYALGDRAKAFLYAQKALAIAPTHQPSKFLIQKLMTKNSEP
jgi:tetratricopeptide (TPR) repeat protein